MDELADKIPFNCIITALTNGGKTRYLIDKLRGSFRYLFEYIILICPTYAKNKTYQNCAKGDKNFFVFMPDASNQDEINDILDC